MDAKVDTGESPTLVTAKTAPAPHAANHCRSDPAPHAEDALAEVRPASLVPVPLLCPACGIRHYGHGAKCPYCGAVLEEPSHADLRRQLSASRAALRKIHAIAAAALAG